MPGQGCGDPDPAPDLVLAGATPDPAHRLRERCCNWLKLRAMSP